MSQINDVDGVMNDHDEDMFSAITSPLASRYTILQQDLNNVAPMYSSLSTKIDYITCFLFSVKNIRLIFRNSWQNETRLRPHIKIYDNSMMIYELAT
jgi:hypothetical protein